MSDGTSIEWTATRNEDGSTTPGATWNPIVAVNKETGRRGWHCEVVSAGCTKPGKDITCYANQINKGFFNLGTKLPYLRSSRDKVDIFLDEKVLLQPLHWREPRTIFVCSMTDWAGAWVRDEWMDKIMAVVAICAQHRFLFLSKRPDRVWSYLTGHAAGGRHVWTAGQEIEMPQGRHKPDTCWPLPNAWMGTSAEDQGTFDERWGWLRQTPAALRWFSLEPLLGPIDATAALIQNHYNCEEGTDEDPTPQHRCWPTADWFVVGGESGPAARGLNLDWVRSIIAQCGTARVACFVKQLGAHPYERRPYEGEQGSEAALRNIGGNPHPTEAWFRDWTLTHLPNGESFYLRSPRLKHKKGGDWMEWDESLRAREMPEIRA